MSEALRLFWYNNFKRHWHRLRYGVRAGRISHETMEWARREAEKIDEIGRENIPSRPYSEFKADVLKRLAENSSPSITGGGE